MALTREQSLREAIAHEEALLKEITRKHEESRRRLAELKQELATAVSAPPVLSAPTVQPHADIPTTAEGKIQLFRQLFRGRDDVYPKLWVSTKTGRKGYSPACSNEWVRGVCEKPRVKCSDCPNRAFLPLNDQTVLDHLQGRHTIGIYPLLKDETCWFLAADFDKESWVEDVAALVDTCHDHGIPTAVERSRSGNGAHVWFFFSTPVPAVSARRLGCFLITETMSRRHQWAMNSYDRLFPNKDTLPRGGFGNLIALPLQYEPRQAGNSVFLDENLQPHPDQWSCFASLTRIAPSIVESIALDATRQGKIIGVRFASTSEDEKDDTPWDRPPSGRAEKASITEPIPAEVHAVFAQRLFVDKTDLPSSLINQIKRLAAFQNPELYRKQNMRLSTALTPRVISCAEELSRHIALPHGCRDELEDLLQQYGSTLAIDDQRNPGELLNVRFNGKLTAIQQQAVSTLCKQDIGVFVAPPGSGKTVVGAWLTAGRQCNTLILVHRQPLLDQWITQLALFLGLEPRDIGQIGGGKHKPNGRLDVAMIQSLVRKDNVDDLVANYGQVIVDECHHLPAVSFERVLVEVRAKFITGLTATPQRRDGHHPIIEMQLGPIRFSVDARNQATQRPFIHKLIIHDTEMSFDDSSGLRIQDLYRRLATDEQRNNMIFNDVLHALEAGRSPILLTERREHLEYFAGRLRKFTRNLVVLQGGKGSKKRRDDLNQLAAIPDNEERLVLATGRYIGEGFDDARLDTLFLALPVSWKGTLIQYAGRLHRVHPDKTEVHIYDYVDRNVPMLARMLEKRLRGYRAIGYSTEEAGMTL
ncbi:MAG: restriction endonuclease subunit R [gamma proteobacterium symbiont of Stewartia floridana]|nr:MAG: restriction endonuclease subunit R [gamma proteobacterium symbiont of Stewartia floridana]RLW60779.1 MAG: restriction endonuclease subunit R [gamma proteobacterium symbiont of Stewartia floridana]RLW62643.1 MAG: restriction endonuclease subunit R [gamma proteobacterium symbiont of Stewartia floridana]RLW71332.1 MAG: restriction endonuclease subunit R [gamma proteobacterium symbiont of Stewartia floridana]